MKQILIYADSLSWGIIPDTRDRFRFDQRWPGVLEQELLNSGISVRVIEDCLNGRRTVWDDPYKPGRNGLEGLEQRIESTLHWHWWLSCWAQTTFNPCITSMPGILHKA